MNEHQPMRSHHTSTRERRMLAAAYVPVFAFAAVLIAARIPRARRRLIPAAVR